MRPARLAERDSASLTCCSFGPFRRVGNKLGNKPLPTVAGPTPAPDLLGPVLRVVVLAAATTGLCQSELLGLRWRDVDWGAQRIRVRNAWVRAEHSAEDKHPDLRPLRPVGARAGDGQRRLRG